MNYRNTSRAQSVSYESGLRTYMIGVFNKMFIALAMTGVVAWLIGSNHQALVFLAKGPMWLCFFALLGLGFVLPMRLHKMQVSTANNLFLLYSALMSIWISPLIAIYTGASIANAFFSTAVFFGGMSLLGYTTKKDLTSIGTFMFIGLITVCITSVVNHFFFHSSSLSMGLSAISVVIFCGLTAYDVQNIKRFYSYAPDSDSLSKSSIFGAFQLYLDFISIFIHLLQLFGNRKD